MKRDFLTYLKRKRKIFFLFFFLVFSILCLANDVLAIEVNYPHIPGAEPPQVFLEKIKNGIYPKDYYVPLLFKYIYFLLLALSGFACLAVGLSGLVLYLISSGSVARMREAQTRFSVGLTGLIILFSSYVIVSIINPQTLFLSLFLHPLPGTGTGGLAGSSIFDYYVEVPLGLLIERVTQKLYEANALAYQIWVAAAQQTECPADPSQCPMWDWQYWEQFSTAAIPSSQYFVKNLFLKDPYSGLTFEDLSETNKTDADDVSFFSEFLKKFLRQVPTVQAQTGGCFHLVPRTITVQGNTASVEICFVSDGTDGDIKLETNGAHTFGWNSWNLGSHGDFCSISGALSGSPFSIPAVMSWTGFISRSPNPACRNFTDTLTCIFNADGSYSCSATPSPPSPPCPPQRIIPSLKQLSECLDYLSDLCRCDATDANLNSPCDEPGCTGLCLGDPCDRVFDSSQAPGGPAKFETVCNQYSVYGTYNSDFCNWYSVPQNASSGSQFDSSGWCLIGEPSLAGNHCPEGEICVRAMINDTKCLMQKRISELEGLKQKAEKLSNELEKEMLRLKLAEVFLRDAPFQAPSGEMQPINRDRYISFEGYRNGTIQTRRILPWAKINGEEDEATFYISEKGAEDLIAGIETVWRIIDSQGIAPGPGPWTTCDAATLQQYINNWNNVKGNLTSELENALDSALANSGIDIRKALILALISRESSFNSFPCATQDPCEGCRGCYPCDMCSGTINGNVCNTPQCSDRPEWSWVEKNCSKFKQLWINLTGSLTGSLHGYLINDIPVSSAGVYQGVIHCGGAMGMAQAMVYTWEGIMGLNKDPWDPANAFEFAIRKLERDGGASAQTCYAEMDSVWRYVGKVAGTAGHAACVTQLANYIAQNETNENACTGAETGPRPEHTGQGKLSIHTGFTGGKSMDFIQKAQPKVVKILDNFGMAAQVKAVSPNTVIIGRIYLDPQPNTAQEWWNRVRNTVLAHPAVDYWEGNNEPDVGTYDKMKAYNDFEVQRIEILAQNGKKACIGNFSTGTPDPTVWDLFSPALQTAKNRGGILGLHEYGAPTMRETSEWHIGRYRMFQIPIPLVFTETGIDGGVIGEGVKGWKSYVSEEEYLADLIWYDGFISQDNYVLGATIFTLEIPGWDNFDIYPIADRLADYVANSQ